MASNRYLPKGKLQAKATPQPRFLNPTERTHRCSWAECTTTAVSKHQHQVYCASHLLKVLQQQWRE